MMPAAAFLLLWAGTGDAAVNPRGRRLETMTWVEAEAVLKEHPLVVIPLGARTKEHGPHLPLNNDWLMAEYLAARVMEDSDVLLLPTVQYGFYPAFLEYPGSVSISSATSRDFIADICRSLGRHGARKFYVLNTGISTVRALEPARELLAAEGLMLEYTDLGEALGAVEKAVRRSEGGTHADEIETSMMLYIAPEAVRMDRAVKDYHPDKGPGGLTRDPEAKTGVYSPTGSWGDPTLATREKGRIVTEALVAHVTGFLARFTRPDFVPRAR